MKIKVLGCSGGIGGSTYRTTAILVDQDTLIDCGTGVGSLSIERLSRIDHVFLTHSHLDHVAMLPMLIDTVGDMRDHPVTVYGLEETLRILHAHLFNWLLWPDFTAIPDREHPLLRMQPVSIGETIRIKNRDFRVLPALHAVPAVGYSLDAGKGSLAFTGDTTVHPPLVEALNTIEDLRYLIIETAFPDSHGDRAIASRHLSPGMLGHFIGGLKNRPGLEIFLTHLKPGHVQSIETEAMFQTAGFSVKILTGGERFEI